MAAVLPHVPASASIDDVLAQLAACGCVVVDGAVAPVVDKVSAELTPLLDAASWGDNDLVGLRTKRVSALLAKSATCAELMVQPLFVQAAERWLGRPRGVEFEEEVDGAMMQLGESIQLSATQAIQIWPGETPQPLHRDDVVHSNIHPGPDTQVQAFFAITHFRSSNGATLVVPGSHLWDDERQPSMDEAIPAEMERGSALVILGSLYHAGGANTSVDDVRIGVSLSYCRANLRQEENQYLSVPIDVVRGYPERVQRLLGYSLCPPFCGFVEMADPHLLLETPA